MAINPYYPYNYCPEPLMYKGCITPKEYLRLYMQLFKAHAIKMKGCSFIFINRKTVKSTTPIRRYKPGGRRK